MIRKFATVSGSRIVSLVLATILAGAATVYAQQTPAEQPPTQQPQQPQTQPTPESPQSGTQEASP